MHFIGQNKVGFVSGLFFQGRILIQFFFWMAGSGSDFSRRSDSDLGIIHPDPQPYRPQMPEIGQGGCDAYITPYTFTNQNQLKPSEKHY